MRKILILLFMVQMVAIQGMATNRVMRESLQDDCLIREKVVTFRMVKLNLLLSIFLITK